MIIVMIERLDIIESSFLIFTQLTNVVVGITCAEVVFNFVKDFSKCCLSSCWL